MGGSFHGKMLVHQRVVVTNGEQGDGDGERELVNKGL